MTRLVITSVHYSDMLAVVLPQWLTIVPREWLLVATSPADVASQALAAQHGVASLATSAWYETGPNHQGEGAKFNLGHGLNVALGLAGAGLVPAPRPGDLLGHVSADCYPVGAWPDQAVFHQDTVYGFWRYECLTPDGLAAHRAGRLPLRRFPRLKNSGGRPIGYCQVFRHQHGRRFGSYPTAGKFDTHFVEQQFGTRFEMRPELGFLHLGPSDVHANWAGRVVPQWGEAVTA